MVIEDVTFFAYYVGIELEELPQLVARDFGKAKILETTPILLGTKSSISGEGKTL